jgi:hypothetical protein
LLTGPEGAGKSTLAYACLKAGMRIVADDIVFFAADGDPIVAWGHSTSIHLTCDAVELFPELRGRPSSHRLNGEVKLRVAVRDTLPHASVAGSTIDGILLLDRTSSGCGISPVSSVELVRSLTGFQGDPPIDAEAMRKMAERLIQLPTGRLPSAGAPATVAACLQEWMENLPTPCTL